MLFLNTEKVPTKIFPPKQICQKIPNPPKVPKSHISFQTKKRFLHLRTSELGQGFAYNQHHLTRPGVLVEPGFKPAATHSSDWYPKLILEIIIIDITLANVQSISLSHPHMVQRTLLMLRSSIKFPFPLSWGENHT